MCIFYSFEADKYTELQAFAGLLNNECIKCIFILSILISIFTFLNILVNYSKSRPLYFFFGISLVVLLALTICSNGINLRKTNNLQRDATSTTCANFQRDISYKDIENGWCQNKYLPEGQTCRKEDLTFNWEQYEQTGVSNYRSLDPSCCRQSESLSLWPFYSLGIWGLFMTAGLMASVIGNLNLSDTYSSLKFKVFITSLFSVI